MGRVKMIIIALIIGLFAGIIFSDEKSVSPDSLMRKVHRSSDFEKKKELLLELSSLYPNYKYTYCMLAEIEMVIVEQSQYYQKKIDEKLFFSRALKYINKAIALDSNYLMGYTRRSEIYEKLGRLKSVERDSIKLCKIYKEGIMNFKKDCDYFYEYNKNDPISVRGLIGKCYDGNYSYVYDYVIKYYEIMMNDPDMISVLKFNTSYIEYAAQSYERLGRLDEAIDAYTEAINILLSEDLKGCSFHIKLLFTRMELLYKNERIEEAKDDYFELVSLKGEEYLMKRVKYRASRIEQFLDKLESGHGSVAQFKENVLRIETVKAVTDNKELIEFIDKNYDPVSTAERLKKIDKTNSEKKER